MPTASGKSYAAPSLRTSAGDIFTTTCRRGKFCPHCFKAVRMRSWLSFTAASGNPTMV